MKRQLYLLKEILCYFANSICISYGLMNPLFDTMSLKYLADAFGVLFLEGSSKSTL